MGAGHLAVALGATKAVPRVNAGWLVVAVFLADFLLGIFALMGLETEHVPPDYASKHYLTFTFPYSHGLAPLVIWGALLGILLAQLLPAARGNRKRVALVVGAAVLSHYLLDGLVHVAGLPVAGENSPKLGLGLWNYMPFELSLETIMVGVGLAIYLINAGARAGALSRYGMSIFAVLITLLTWNQLSITKPPEHSALVTGWIVGILLFSAVAFWLDHQRIRRAV